jgi:hypothetical protein
MKITLKKQKIDYVVIFFNILLTNEIIMNYSLMMSKIYFSNVWNTVSFLNTFPTIESFYFLIVDALFHLFPQFFSQKSLKLMLINLIYIEFLSFPFVF